MPVFSMSFSSPSHSVQEFSIGIKSQNLVLVPNQHVVAVHSKHVRAAQYALPVGLKRNEFYGRVNAFCRNNDFVLSYVGQIYYSSAFLSATCA